MAWYICSSVSGWSEATATLSRGSARSNDDCVGKRMLHCSRYTSARLTGTTWGRKGKIWIIKHQLYRIWIMYCVCKAHLQLFHLVFLREENVNLLVVIFYGACKHFRIHEIKWIWGSEIKYFIMKNTLKQFNGIIYQKGVRFWLSKRSLWNYFYTKHFRAQVNKRFLSSFAFANYEHWDVYFRSGGFKV